MIQAIKDFFSTLIEPAASGTGASDQHALQVATAALLVEMMRMDERVAETERAAVTDALRVRFGLSDAEVERLIALAEEEAREAPGYYAFTSLINKGFSAEQKIRVVEYMWQVAYADGHLDAHENHLMRKIADLLYISHGDYIAAKQRGRAAAGYPEPEV